MEEVIRELREQLRTREELEATNANQREALKERENEIDFMRTEIDGLRKQKDGLMKALRYSSRFCLMILTVRTELNYAPIP